MKGFYQVELFDCPPFEMFTVDDCAGGKHILEEKSFEPQSMKLWCQLVKTSKLVIDVGAHVGIYSLAAAAIRNDIPIHAYEPNPDAFARLALHQRINQFWNIALHRDAIADSERYLALSWNPRDWITSGASIVLGLRKEVVIAHCVTLDSIALQHSEIAGPWLVKIDVEGAEELVFKGAASFLERRPDIILETFAQSACDLLNKRLPSLGYKIWFIDERNGLQRRETIQPADVKSKSFNHFLSVHYDNA